MVATNSLARSLVVCQLKQFYLPVEKRVNLNSVEGRKERSKADDMHEIGELKT